MQGQYDQEYFPENAENSEGFSGKGHIHKSAADIERKQWHNDGVEHLVDDMGKIVHHPIKGVPAPFSAQGGKTEPKDKSEKHGG